MVSKWFIVFINTLSFKQVTLCSMHSIVTTFRGADIKVEVANFCAAMDTLIDQDDRLRNKMGWGIIQIIKLVGITDLAGLVRKGLI